MCIQAIAGIAPLFSALGSVVGVAGTLVQAKAQSDAATARSVQEENNKVIAQRNAQDARDRGNIEQQNQQLKTRARLGMQKNALSERNLAVSSGSALEILGDTALTGKLDEITTGNNFQREAISYETQAYNFSAQAEQSRMEAKNAKTAGVFGALGGVFDGFSKYNKLGMAL